MADPKIGPPYDHILEEEVADEILLFDTELEVFVSLNSTASDVWRLVTGEFSVDDIIDRLASSYDIEPDAIRSDVESTIAGFAKKELIPKLT